MPIFCDLDEVFTDFTGEACKVHGWTRERLEAYRTPGDWSMQQAMGLSETEFWEPIHRMGESFWTNMPLLPWANQIIRMLNGTDWYIITSPVSSDDTPVSLDVWTGKLKWLHKHLDWRVTRCHVTAFKHHFARIPGAILIDDREANVEKFIDEGGEGIVFPSWCNSLFSLAKDPVPYVKAALERYHAFTI